MIVPPLPNVGSKQPGEAGQVCEYALEESKNAITRMASWNVAIFIMVLSVGAFLTGRELCEQTLAAEESSSRSVFH